MTPLLAIVSGVLALVALALFAQARNARNALEGAQSARQTAEDRLDGVRAEITSTKEDLKRKTNLLEEARTAAKKKARRDGKKDKKREDGDDVAEARDESDEALKLKQANKALELQLKSVTDAAKNDASALFADEKAALQADAKKHKAHASEVEKTLKDLRESIRRKAEDRPDIPGSALDLKSLPAEVVQELAKYFRKGEEFERLYHVSQGKMQLASERQQELQKRYYAVCRELAVAAGAKATEGDQVVQKSAEAIVAKGDSVSGEVGAKKKRPRRRKKRTEGEGRAEAKADEGKTDERKTDERKTDERKTDEPKAESKAEAPKAEEPKAESPKTESPKTDVPADGEAKVDKPKAEEPTAGEPKSDEPKNDKADEPKADEAKAEQQASG